ncbi:LysR family transcriptional regulator [Shewanella avicenniae]|uniref:LysR family transcriptional regulator n=1 Tax=Shewanella avicenniae TaxID=2814294 RepID=A0ABX7QVD9_9GAMM|nr:LysR family transcriptional regulator [Shewanella avicenniae]QSX34987.1 LysR family transcriptional regulator [Shewanella avicenniae]
MKLHQLDLNLLLAFDALMIERNVTRAAARIYLSQPAMSHALNRLRQAFNDPLLVRTPQGMLPTERALSLHQGVQQALKLLEQQLDAPEQFDPASSNRRFVISTTDYVECVLIPPLIAKLNQLAPGVHIEIEILRETIPEVELANGDIDLVLGFDEYMQVPAYLARETWLSEPLAALVRREHPSITEQISLQQLVETPHVFHSPLGTHDSIIDRYLKSQGLTRQISVNSQSYMSAAAIVSQTDHLLVLPARVAKMLCVSGQLRQVALPNDMPNYQLNCVWHPVHQGLAPLNWLKGLMRGLVHQ